VTRAAACLIWRVNDENRLEPRARAGSVDAELGHSLEEAAARARIPAAVEPLGAALVISVPLGKPQLGVLQLLFPPESPPSEAELAALGAFAGRSAQALRAGERAGEVRRELERTRDLLSVVG